MCEWFLCEMRKRWRIPVHILSRSFRVLIHTVHIRVLPITVLLMLSFFIDVTDNSLSYYYYNFFFRFLLDIIFFYFLSTFAHFGIYFYFWMGLGVGLVFKKRKKKIMEAHKSLYTCLKSLSHVSFIIWIKGLKQKFTVSQFYKQYIIYETKKKGFLIINQNIKL